MVSPLLLLAIVSSPISASGPVSSRRSAMLMLFLPWPPPMPAPTTESRVTRTVKNHLPNATNANQRTTAAARPPQDLGTMIVGRTAIPTDTPNNLGNDGL